MTPLEVLPSFENFIVHSSNRLAYRACCEFGTPGSSLKAVRGLFLWALGPWGKSHLLEAVRASLEAARLPAIKIPAQKFIDSPLVDWRDCAAILLDDVELLAASVDAQQRLIQIFDEAGGARLIFTASVPPRELPLIEPLRSRLGGGLVLNIEPPEFELMMELAAAKARVLELAATEEALSALARQAGNDVRHLYGLLETAAFVMANTGQTLDEAARRVCPETAGPPLATEQISIETVMAEVAAAFGLKVADLTGLSKIRQAAWPRRVAMLLAREMTTLTTTDIGAAFGGRDHSTVIHALKKINEEMKKPPQAKLVENIRRSILMGGTL